MAAVNRQRIAELVEGGMTARTAGRQERAERAGFSTYGEHEYAQRKARADKLGYRSFREGQAARKEARTTGDTAPLKGGDRPGGTPRRQVFRVGPGRVIVKTRAGDPAASIGPLMTALRNASSRKQVKFLVDTADGKTRTIYGQGGWNVGQVLDAIDGHGDIFDYLDAEIGELYDGYTGGAGAITAVQVVIG